MSARPIGSTARTLLGLFYLVSALFLIVPLGWVFADDGYPVICNVAMAAATIAPVIAFVRLRRHRMWRDHIGEVSLLLFVVLVLLAVCGGNFG